MKIMYVASNPLDESSLNLEKEITELQQRLAESAGEPIQLIFLPGLKVEDLPRELTRRKPDILHLSAHAKDETLSLFNDANSAVRVTASMLTAFFNPEHAPRLVYLNACDSDEIAKAVVGTVPMAIGTTAPITNRAARESAVAFYERLLAGFSVDQAFRACQKMLELLEDSTASAHLFHRKDIDPETEILHPIPRLIAEFEKPKSDNDGAYWFRLGLIGCPPNTTQVVFFTDDESFIYDVDEIDENLCTVARGAPEKGGIVWFPEGTYKATYGDCRLFATGVTGDRSHYTTSAFLCEALENRYLLRRGRKIPDNITRGIRALRAYNNPTEPEPKETGGKKQKKAR